MKKWILLLLLLISAFTEAVDLIETTVENLGFLKTRLLRQ